MLAMAISAPVLSAQTVQKSSRVLRRPFLWSDAVLAWQLPLSLGAGVGPLYEGFVFGIEHLDWPPGDGSKRLAPIQIVYAFFPSDGLLPDSFFDCSKRYELQAVRDTRCDESVESLSYLKSVDVDSGIAAILRITIPGWSAQRRPRAGCGPRLLHSETRKVQSPNREGGDGSI